VTGPRVSPFVLDNSVTIFRIGRSERSANSNPTLDVELQKGRHSFWCEVDSAMTITLTLEQKRVADEEIKSGYFSTPGEVLGEALTALREKKESRREAGRRLAGFADKHRLSLAGISIKELIHEGHRL
jgi:Arc/MetJ-type ribon-helix-helix transcriptional regulator